MKILRTYENGVDQKTAEELAKGQMLTNKEMDYEIEHNYDAIRPALDAWTRTHIKYAAGATEALIWNEGEKPEKIHLPLNDGWYLPDDRYCIPNGEASSEDNPKARYLYRRQSSSFDGLLVRRCGWFDGRLRRGVVAYYGPGGRLGVCVRDEKSAAQMPDVLETLAAIEHEQWVAWSKDLAKKEKLTPERVKRWKGLWVPYAKLSEDMKEHDRKWARKALEAMGTPAKPGPDYKQKYAALLAKVKAIVEGEKA